MADGDPTTPGDFQADSALIDALMQKHYGCTLDEFGARAVNRGYALGRAQRREKSSKMTAKQLMPFLMNDIGWRADARRIPRAAAKVVKQMAVGTFVSNLPDGLSEPEEAAEVAKFLKLRRRATGIASPPTLAREYFRQRKTK
jgi:hypothetical protein